MMKQKMRDFLFLAFFSLSCFLGVDCSHSPTGPGNNLSDTTSHAWTFTINFLGDGGGSALYDISVVNDTLAYAAGAVYKQDSSGNFGINPYDLAVFDGQRWNLEQVKVSFHGNTIIVPLQGVYAFSSTQIWLAASLPIYGNGTTSQMYDLRTILNPYIDVSKTWGSNAQQMYFVGLNGTFVSYFNGNWQKITSGTSLNIQDVYGSGGTILAIASNPGQSLDKQILQISGTTVTQLSTTAIQWPLSGVWFVPGHYYVVGQGIYWKNSLSDNVWQQDSVDTVDFFSCIRGNAWNDFFVAGGYGQLIHFNGKTWQSYQNVLGMQNGAIARIAVRGNLMMAVGQLGSKAVAIVGRR